MRTLIRNMALLLICGVVAPICQHTGPANAGPDKAALQACVAAQPPDTGSGFSFSFIKDVAAKLLPFAELFK